MFETAEKAWPPVVYDAISIVTKLLTSETFCEAVFLSLAQKFQYQQHYNSHELRAKDVYQTLTEEVINKKISIVACAEEFAIIQTFRGESMEMCIAINPKYTIALTSIERDRCLFLLVVKILHGICHLLTNSFHALAGVDIWDNYICMLLLFI